MDDVISLIILLVLILVCVLLIKMLENRKKNIDMVEQLNKNKIDLEAITKNIEETYKPVTIKLTDYEQEQEDKAIISYDELVRNGVQEVSYEPEFKNESTIEIKKIDLENTSSSPDHNRIGVTLMSYEAEESFLKALRQLQNNLVR